MERGTTQQFVNSRLLLGRTPQVLCSCVKLDKIKIRCIVCVIDEGFLVLKQSVVMAVVVA